MTHIARVLAAVLAILFACTAGLAACAPANEAVLATTPEPTATATMSSTPTASPTATPSPTPSPEPTPQMTREEALKRLNITSNEAYSFSSLIIYECTLKNGREVKFMACTRQRITDDAFVDLNVTDYEPFAEYYLDEISVISQFDIMDEVDINLVPEFLKGATITSTYGVCNIPDIYEERGIELPRSQIIDYIVKYMAEGADHYVLTETYLTALDCANFLLDICPLDQMIWAKDYIEDFEELAE